MAFVFSDIKLSAISIMIIIVHHHTKGYASKAGNWDFVELLLSQFKADPNGQDDVGGTPLGR